MKYKFIKNLGNGSYGEVFLAESREKELYAIKKFPLYDKSSYASFKNEIKILKKIKHKNLVKIYDHFKNRSYIYLVMEYAPLGDLDNYIRSLRKKGKILSDNTLDNIISQVTEGIDHLHVNNIIHRDIKTSNILVFNENLFKITDFGVSKNLEMNNYAYTNIGTPYYMAPEIICGKPYTFSVDYWALGCMIYKLITNKYPFEAHNIGALILKIKRGHFNIYSLPIKYKELVIKLLKNEIYYRGNKKDILKFLKKLAIDDYKEEINDPPKKIYYIKKKVERNYIYQNSKNEVLKPINKEVLKPINKEVLKPINKEVLKPINKDVVKPTCYGFKINEKIKNKHNDRYYLYNLQKNELPPLKDNLIKPKIDCWNYDLLNKERKKFINKKKEKLPPIHLKDIHNIKTKDMPMKNNKKDFIKFNRQNIVLMHKR